MTTERKPNSGHQIDEVEFLGDVSRLCAWLTAGDREILHSSGCSENDPAIEALFVAVSAHQAREIPRLLVSIAATLRAKLDDGSWRVRTKRDVAWANKGHLIDAEKGKSLPLREVCNRIMHATKVIPAHSASRGGQKFLGDNWTLWGDRQGEPWTTEIYVLQFVIAAANVDFGAS